MCVYAAAEIQDKLLNKLEESEPEPPTSQEDECVICINARATMQTSPCGHRVSLIGFLFFCQTFAHAYILSSTQLK